MEMRKEELEKVIKDELNFFTQRTRKSERTKKEQMKIENLREEFKKNKKWKVE